MKITSIHVDKLDSKKRFQNITNNIFGHNINYIIDVLWMNFIHVDKKNPSWMNFIHNDANNNVGDNVGDNVGGNILVENMSFSTCVYQLKWSKKCCCQLKVETLVDNDIFLII